MKIIFLGTGTSQGIPLINCTCEVCQSSNPKDKRLRSSIFIQGSHTNILIDSGPDLRQQALQNQITQIDAVLYTHSHSDHTAGIDDLRPFHFSNKKPMDVYAENLVLEDIKKRFYYAFLKDPYPGAIKLTLHAIEAGHYFTINEFSILPIKIRHGDLDIIGFRINDFAYLTDVKFISEDSLHKLSGCKILVINALREQAHHSHVNLYEAIQYIQKIEPQEAYLVHMSHQIGKHNDLLLKLPSHVYPAYDGLEISI